MWNVDDNDGLTAGGERGILNKTVNSGTKRWPMEQEELVRSIDQ